MSTSFGTILLPAFLLFTHAGFVFGYAKPVPVNFARAQQSQARHDLGGRGRAWHQSRLGARLRRAAVHRASRRRGAGRLLGDDAVASLQINLVLAVLNMLPLPPLDGGRVLTGLLPHGLAEPFARFEPYGFVIILGALFLLPFIGAKLGLDLDVFSWLVGRPVNWMMHGDLRRDGAALAICSGAIANTAKAGAAADRLLFSRHLCRASPACSVSRLRRAQEHAPSRAHLPHLLPRPGRHVPCGAGDAGNGFVPRMRALCSLRSPVVRAMPAPSPCMFSRLRPARALPVLSPAYRNEIRTESRISRAGRKDFSGV